MLREIYLSTALLAAFGLVGAGLVALVHMGTAERIEANREAATLARLHEILPDGEYDNDIINDTTVLSHALLGGGQHLVYRARRNDEPVAAVFTVIARGGYSGDIHLLVGVRENGQVAGVRVISHRETPGLGDDIEASRSDWILGFDNLALDDPPMERWAVQRDGGIFDQFTGATITPRAVVRAVRDTLIYFDTHREQVFTPIPVDPTDEEAHADE
ncbi:electron transport complex protein RnfG [Ectothiorhodospira magna]|uniref:Ion-translocating oxidoreductase complex subunit G n=1 Tax=Ectothiorhodospira magna TaxID=867345 RepID=A0A1H9FZ24_9GAMM|nr:electron transport complex subunit RsxG [Ectothiorhodospira magna]SEQ43069.1 electron transport complex protein RnfG [Ectothiorhodospira magna]